MAEGAAFTDSDVRDGRPYACSGQTVVTNLFGDESPIGKDVRMQGVAFRVVGVLEPQGRQHARHGPGRYCARPLDHDQISRQRLVVDPNQSGLQLRRRQFRSQPASSQ